MQIHRRPLVPSLFVPTLARAVGFLLAAVLAPAAIAKDDYDKLDPDEGLLLVAVENGIGAESVRVSGEGLFNTDVAGRLDSGRNVRLMRFPAGKYRWAKVSLGTGAHFNLDRTAAYEFTVEAGVINYPGELVMQPVSWRSATFGRYNKASLAMMLLDKAHPGVRTRYRWRNDVASPDPFPEFFAQHVPADRTAALVGSADADAKKAGAHAIDPAFTDAFNELFAPALASSPSLSPGGDFVAYKQKRKDVEVAVVVDLASGMSVDAVSTAGSIDEIEWAGDGLLFVDTGNGIERLRFGAGVPSAKNVELVRYPDTFLVDPLPDDPQRAIVVRGDRQTGDVHLYALDKTAKRYSAGEFSASKRLDRDLPSMRGAFVDPAGELRAAIVADAEDKHSLMAKTGGTWKTVRAMPAFDRYSPLMLTADGASLIVLTNEARAQVELVRVALDTGEVAETLLSMPGTDIESALLRQRDRVVLGGLIYRGGQPTVEYLRKGGNRLAASIAAAFPGSSAVVWDESRDARYAIALVHSEANPGSYYLYDSKEKKLEELFDSRAPFEKVKPVVSKAFTVRTPDGFDIQAFLTLPAHGGKPHPLVVMPHGGPFGVSDALTFDPTVQLLVHSGFAVLRVNYRGSGGAGRAFLEAGYGTAGREIEDDIERALDHALANFALDRDRVALFGASYGGYSTLMGLIRAPQRFRCGVAISAPSDLLLSFSSSDWASRPESVAMMKRVRGDPATQADALREVSPAYQYERLKQPLLLIHGTSDVRVSFEHAWRMRTLLANAGRPPTWLPLPGAGHSLSRAEDRFASHSVSDVFLRECLKPTSQAAPAGTETN